MLARHEIIRITAVAAAWSLLLIVASAALDAGCSADRRETSVAPTDTVSPEMMREDFEYVIDKLKSVHPATIDGFTPIQDGIIAGIRGAIARPMTKEEFFFAVNELFHSFRDAHTTQWLVFSQGIDLPLVWLRDGLFVERDADLLQRGDSIETIGGRSVPELFELVNAILWTENGHLTRLEGAWMLTARPYLRHMGLMESDSVRVTYRRSGRECGVRLPIVEIERPHGEERPFFAVSIDTTVGAAVLTLDACRYNDEYRTGLRGFFGEVSARGIDAIILDLRRNDGGDSRVIDEFLRYIDIDRLKTYGSTTRHCADSRMQTKTLGLGVEEHPRSERENRGIEDEELLFSGSLYVLTSPNTFSSANMFAATIQDNRIGTIVGEPTGNQPSCYGHPLSFRMPRSGIYFKVSHKRFFRPDSMLDRVDAVYPDVEAYRTIGDVIHAGDSQMERVMTLIARGRNGN